jgi:hypothetical protein
MTDFYLLVAAFFIIAVIYSSVGFGGGSSYLALLAVMAVDYELIRPTALFCNVMVVTGGAYIFYKAGKLDFKKALPFVVVSIPAAFLGGYYPIKERSFFIILGISLVAAALLLWWKVRPGEPGGKSGRAGMSMMLGGGIGFLSGLVSIGGGIFLSPVLHLMKWDDAKKISALASLFILVNSISGLAGQFTQGMQADWNFIWPLLLAVLLGGQIGSRLGANVFDRTYIRRITAILIFAAGVNILRSNL